MNLAQALAVDDAGFFRYRPQPIDGVLGFEISRVPRAALEAMHALFLKNSSDVGDGDGKLGFRAGSVPQRTLEVLAFKGEKLSAEAIAERISLDRRRGLQATRKQVSVALVKLINLELVAGEGFRPRLFWITELGELHPDGRIA